MYQSKTIITLQGSLEQPRMKKGSLHDGCVVQEKWRLQDFYREDEAQPWVQDKMFWLLDSISEVTDTATHAMDGKEAQILMKWRTEGTRDDELRSFSLDPRMVRIRLKF